MSSEQTQPSIEPGLSLPFDSAGDGIPFDRFSDRAQVRDLLSFMMWDPTEVGASRFFSLIIRGARTFGKTSIAHWCKGSAEQRSREHPGEKKTLVCHYQYRGAFESATHFYDDLWWCVASELMPHVGRFRKIQIGSWRLFRRTYKKVSNAEAEAAGFKLPQIKEESDAEALARKIDRWLSRVNHVGCLLLIIDEIGGAEQEAVAVRRCANLVKAMKGHRWQSGVRIGITLLPLPTWSAHVELENDPRRYLSRPEITLGPFSATETTELVGDEIGRCSGWSADTGFSSELYRLSGGFPLLVQRLGHAAALACLAETSSNRIIRSSHLSHAVASDGTIHAALEYTIHLAGKYAAESPIELEILRAIGDTLPEEYAESGAPMEDWSDVLVGPETSRSEERRRSFDRLWNHLARAYLIVSVGADRYRFGPQAVRQRLPLIAQNADRA